MYLLFEDPSEYSEKNKSEQPLAGGGGLPHEPQSSKQFGGTMVSTVPTSTILLV
jgi:hypothetical protein